MALSKGSRVNMFYFFTFENGFPSKMLASFRSTSLKLHDNIVSVSKQVLRYNDVFDPNSDWSKTLVVTDLLKRPVVGPVSDFSIFLNGDFCLQSV